MILVDTSVWIEHLRHGRAELSDRLNQGAVLGHPWVTGELALGRLANRDEVLELLGGLPQATVASDDELLGFIAAEHLSGTGVGYVDAQLLAATRLTPDAWLWSADKRLSTVAARLGLDGRG